MKKHFTKQWLLILLMAVVSITTAFADERDMRTWSENKDFGQNGANMTTDGYSLWDGQSFQNYELRTSGEQQGIHQERHYQRLRNESHHHAPRQWRTRERTHWRHVNPDRRQQGCGTYPLLCRQH